MARIVVGSADFPESALLAEIYAGALEAKGIKVTTKPQHRRPRGLHPGAPGRLDRPDPRVHRRAGATTSTRATRAPTPTAVYTDAQRPRCPATLTVLDKSAAEDKDASSSPRRPRPKSSLKSIADLAGAPGRHHRSAARRSGRPATAGIPGFKKIYGVEFKAFRPLTRPALVQRAEERPDRRRRHLHHRPDHRRQRLRRPRGPEEHVCRAEHRPADHQGQATPTIEGALNAVSAKLDTATLADLLKQVVVDKKDADGRGQGVPDQQRPRLTERVPQSGSCTSTSTSSSRRSRCCGDPALAGKPVVVGGRGDPTERGRGLDRVLRGPGVRCRLRDAAAHRRDARRRTRCSCRSTARSTTAASERGHGRPPVLGHRRRSSRCSAGTRRSSASPTDDPEALRPAGAGGGPRPRPGCTARSASATTQVPAKIGDRVRQAAAASTRLTADNWFEVMGHRPTDALWGVGRKTAAKLEALGISTVRELAAPTRQPLVARARPDDGPVVPPARPRRRPRRR